MKLVGLVALVSGSAAAAPDRADCGRPAVDEQDQPSWTRSQRSSRSIA